MRTAKIWLDLRLDYIKKKMQTYKLAIVLKNYIEINEVF